LQIKLFLFIYAVWRETLIFLHFVHLSNFHLSFQAHLALALPHFPLAAIREATIPSFQ
jgi:hypothetical protein